MFRLWDLQKIGSASSLSSVPDGHVQNLCSKISGVKDIENNFQWFRYI